MPFTTKPDLVVDQAAHPPHGTNHTYPLERYTRFCQTSGTTARPLVILDTPESWEWMLGNWAHIYRAAGLAPGDRIYFAFSFGPFLGFWTAFDAAAKLGYLGIPGRRTRQRGALRALIQHRADGAVLHADLCAAPRARPPRRKGSTLRSGSAEDHRGGRNGRQRSRSAGAHFRGLEWRGSDRSLWHDRGGPGGLSERRRSDGLLHIIEDSYFAEIVDPKPAKPSPPARWVNSCSPRLGRTPVRCSATARAIS